MKIFLATWLFESNQGVSLNRKNVKNRLLSYFHTKEKKRQFISYVKKGENKR